MTFRYIGSKSRLIDQITCHIPPAKSGSFFIDAFCGTGVVAEAAANMGWNVRINDNLNSAVVSTGARLVSVDQAQFKKLGGYNAVIEKLNHVSLVEGFIWRTYSPASVKFCGIERKYFTENNAAKIDAMRLLIAEWSMAGKLNENEETVLLGDLLSALNRIANIAGTFGCFLSKWTKQSQRSIALRPRSLKRNSVQVESIVGDVSNLPNSFQDVVYLDPPYTKRQYASYYHILETVTLGDEPEVVGVGGLRPWKNLASDYCYKTKALKSLSSLIQNLEAYKIILSYSSEGHICMEDMSSELSRLGDFSMYPLGSIGRYRPNKTASKTASDVNEFLVVIENEEQSLNTGAIL